MTFLNPHCPPQQRALKAAGPASGDRMSLLSQHLVSPAHASNFLWLSAGLPSVWGSGVDNEPHLGGSWVLKTPLLLAFEASIHVLPGGLLLWLAPLFSISSGESINMSTSVPCSEMCWDTPAQRLLPSRVSWTQILLRVHPHFSLIIAEQVSAIDKKPTTGFRVKHTGEWIQDLLGYGDTKPQGRGRSTERSTEVFEEDLHPKLT